MFLASASFACRLTASTFARGNLTGDVKQKLWTLLIAFHGPKIVEFSESDGMVNSKRVPYFKENLFKFGFDQKWKTKTG